MENENPFIMLIEARKDIANNISQVSEALKIIQGFEDRVLSLEMTVMAQQGLIEILMSFVTEENEKKEVFMKHLSMIVSSADRSTLAKKAAADMLSQHSLWGELLLSGKKQ